MRFFTEIPLFIALMVSWVHSEACGDVTLTGNRGVFTSPNYPNRYDHKLSCSWTISASRNHFVQLTFVEFDLKSPFLKCDHDYVTVDNGTGIVQTFCNNQRPDDVMKSVGGVMQVTLHTDDFFRNGNGFKATYDIVDEDGNCIEKGEDEADDETTDVVTTSTKTQSTSTKQSTKNTRLTTTMLLTKLLKATTKRHQSDDDRELHSGDPGKTSGFVIGAIVVVIVAVVSIICAIAFARYRKNKNKRISLSVIVTPDDKELISNGKIYKKIGNKLVNDPEAETFPL